MKKKLTALLLAAMMVLSLLPAESLAADAVPEGWTPIYSIADLKAINDWESQFGTKQYILMTDIDASREEFDYYYAYNSLCYSVTASLPEGYVLDGNGHTIYNLKTGLFQTNSGTIKDLNVTIHDTESDAGRLPATDGYYTYYGLARRNGSSGLIQNCNVQMNVERSAADAGYSVEGIGCYNDGIIRNCIIDFDVNIDIGTADRSINFAGISMYNNPDYYDGLTDHCLIIGDVYLNSMNFSGQCVGIGIKPECTDSAVALDSFYYACNHEFNVSPLCYAGTSESALARIKNCRVSSDMKYTRIAKNDKINMTALPASNGEWTTATKAAILADWDLSTLPDGTPDITPKPGTTPEPIPTPPLPEEELPTGDPFSFGDRTFHFSGTNGEKREWSFNYSDLFFYGQEDSNFSYDPDLANASLCLEMASFSDVEHLQWDKTLQPWDTSRATNIKELYNTLGFGKIQCVNYDVPLTDTSDKAAFALGAKYIRNLVGPEDTLVAVAIRGGNYGGEWTSNFNVIDSNSTVQNHIGFQTAADGVFEALSDYVDSIEVKGNLKIWVVGFSRAAAVANLLGGKLNTSKLNGNFLNKRDIYVYTFATPAGATAESTHAAPCPNIYNIVSPVDLVPRVAPSQWKFSRYGTTLSLPYNNYDALWETYEDISGVGGENIPQSQRELLNVLGQTLFDLNTASPSGNVTIRYGILTPSLQNSIMNMVTNTLSKNPTGSDAPPTAAHRQASALEIMSGLANVLGKQALLPYRLLSEAAADIARAHHPEYYLARLECDGLRDKDDFGKANATVQVTIPDWLPTHDARVNYTFRDRFGNPIGSYADGVCVSGTVTVEKTELGIVATYPAGQEVTMTVTGAGADALSFYVSTYDGTQLDAARTVSFADFPLFEGGEYTCTIPAEIDGEYWLEDEDGNWYEPDEDSSISDEPDEEVGELPFTDVDGHWAYEAIAYAYDNGLMNGTSDTRFTPNGTMNRAMLVTILYRLAGEPEVYEGGAFSDVAAGTWYTDAVCWASENDIVNGVGSGRFAPMTQITREQMATMLYRYARYEGYDTEDRATLTGYADAGRISSWALEPLRWASAAGLISGRTASTIVPDGTATRAEAATILMRFVENVW